MLPVIDVWNGEKDDFLVLNSLDESKVMFFDGEGAKIDELRQWINMVFFVITDKDLVFWNVDQMGLDCQSILLKPLEECVGERRIFLVVKNENGLIEAIVSRCAVNKGFELKKEGVYWNDVKRCWKGGVFECIDFSDKLTSVEAKEMVDEIIIKIKQGFVTGVNEKRLVVLKMAFELAFDLKLRGVSVKMAVGDFLLRSWKVIIT